MIIFHKIPQYVRKLLLNKVEGRSKMTLLDKEQPKSKEELEKLIEKAIKKINGSKENALCRYIPGPSGGYMHHFTMRKLKNSNPEELFELLQKFILKSENPKTLHPKQRAPRGSRTRKDFINFTRTDIEKILELAREVGNKDLVARFSPKRSLPSLKKELIRSIRKNQISQHLWTAYTESISVVERSESSTEES